MPFKNIDPVYSIWQGMRRRCLTPTTRGWNNYGGRGIAICSGWDDFHQFKADMGPRPKGTSLERINTNGDYKAENCRWATRKEQQRNQRRTIVVKIEGKKYKAIELAELSGMKVDTIVSRAKKKMTYKQVMADTYYYDTKSWKNAVAARVAKQRAMTHCKHGHRFTVKNTYVYKGCRSCRICHKLRRRLTVADD